MTKHVEGRHHYTKELVYARTIAVIFIPASGMLTD
jgi:hypothetical protein